MSTAVANICLFCRKDCSFFAHCEGCCIPCGDALMEDKHKLFISYVKTCQISQDNGRDAQRFRKLMDLAVYGGTWQSAPGAPIQHVWRFRPIMGPHANLHDAIDQMGGK